jgi:hypothetical protein
MADEVDAIFKRLRRLAGEAGPPGIEESTSYGTPALNNETVLLSLAVDDKEHLIEMGPAIYHQTDHYVGWPSLPVRIAAIGDDELKERLIGAWLFRAPKKLAATFRC